MNINRTQRPSALSVRVNRAFYAGFIFMGTYFALVSHDWSSAMANMGIALIFDPLDPKVMWNQRPLYQRVWLFTHAALVLALLPLLLIQKT